MNDLEWPWVAICQYLTSKSVFGQHSVSALMRLLEPTAHIWMKIDPYYQRQKYRPMNLVAERFMRIFAGVPLGGGVKRHWGLSTTAIFDDLGGYVFENVRQAIICNDMLPFVDRQMIAKWMTLNDLEWLLHDKIRFRPARLESERLNVRNSTTSAILRCSVHSALPDQLASLGKLRHAQLTRCFSAVAPWASCN